MINFFRIISLKNLGFRCLALPSNKIHFLHIFKKNVIYDRRKPNLNDNYCYFIILTVYGKMIKLLNQLQYNVI